MSTFKKSQVVMLSTSENSSIAKEADGLLKFIGTTKSTYVNSEYHSCQNLYFLSDDEIKESDFGYNIISKTIDVFTDSLLQNKQYYKKIIATTDTLGVSNLTTGKLPNPSKEFIEVFIQEYNKGNIITEVMVEYENFDSHVLGLDRIKINPKDNTITIRKVKDSWNREEVKELLEKWVDNTQKHKGSLLLWEWIKENL